jgi:multidrug transporter EmrE-like cation transporter
VVFPIAIGGSIFIVILGGRFLFGERLNRLTTGGVSFGLAAIILLGLS